MIQVDLLLEVNSRVVFIYSTDANLKVVQISFLSFVESLHPNQSLNPWPFDVTGRAPNHINID